MENLFEVLMERFPTWERWEVEEALTGIELDARQKVYERGKFQGAYHYWMDSETATQGDASDEDVLADAQRAGIALGDDEETIQETIFAWQRVVEQEIATLAWKWSPSVVEEA